MDTIGLDLHKRESQLCILTEDGEVTERRIITSRERFTAVLGAGQAGPCVLSMVDRKTGYLVVGQLRRRTSADVNARARQLIAAQPHRVRTITVDNGTGFHEYVALERATAVRFYFATAPPRVGTGDEREHQRPVPPVPPQAPEHGAPHPARQQSDCPEAQPPAPQAARLPHPGGMPWLHAPVRQQLHVKGTTGMATGELKPASSRPPRGTQRARHTRVQHGRG